MIVISACLAGFNVRYDGGSNFIDDEFFLNLIVSGRCILFCPEVVGGMDTPRRPAEIINGCGRDVLEKRCPIKNNIGEDVTKPFLSGVEKSFYLINKNKIDYAILKDGSPSCGCSYIYDGSFSGKTKEGKGVFAAFLEKNGVLVFNEKNYKDLKEYIQKQKKPLK